MIPTSLRAAVFLHRRLELISLTSIPALHYFSSSLEDSNPSSLPLETFSKKELFVVDYLTKNFSITEKRVKSKLRRIPRIQTPDKPDSVLSLFQHYGFSDNDIRKIVQIYPTILFLDVENVLKPKLELFREIGFSGPHLGVFLSKSPSILTYSLEKRLIPSLEILRRFLPLKDIISVLSRCRWIVTEDPNLRLIPNITFLRDCCGIVGLQLSTFLLRQPSLFVKKHDSVRDLVQKTIEMGFVMNSQMFVYGLHSMSCIAPTTIKRKMDWIRSYGFSDEDFKKMFRTTPAFIRCSTEKLQVAIEFFLNQVGLEPSELVRCPTYLMYSMEKRIAPRFRVLQILDSKKLLKKGTTIRTVLHYSEEDFLKKYILRYEDYVAELLNAYQFSTGVPLDK